MDADLKDAFVLAVAAHVHAFLHKELELAVQLYDRALELNENSAFAWGMSGITYGYLGEGEEALQRFRRAWRLSPSILSATSSWWAQEWPSSCRTATTRRLFGCARRSASIPGSYPAIGTSWRHSRTLAGSPRRGRLARSFSTLEPGFSVSTLASWYPLRPQENLDRYVSGLRAAGLPD